MSPRRARLDQALFEVALTRLRRPFFRWPPPAPARGAYFKTIARPKLDSNFLGAQHARRPVGRCQAVVVGNAVVTAENSAGAIAHAIARGVGKGRFCGFKDKIQRNAKTAAKLSV